ncbi:MAG: LamG domain-containing protein, partial [Opitutae bacterium]
MKLSGTNQTRGSSGGRVALHAQAEVFLGDVDVNGEWMSNPGSIYVGGSYYASSIDLDQGTLIFDTKSGCFLVEGGPHGVGVTTSTSFKHGVEDPWNYEICTFTFTHINIGPEVEVILRGDKPLSIQTVAGGDIIIATDFILDGENASTDSGYGGLGVLNPWSGRSSEALPGYGPGGTEANDLGAGTGATYNYNPDGKTLVPGSSGSSGSSFQGSGAGGGALQIAADGDFILDSGALISASGGNGRSDQDPTKPGGGGSGGTIHIFAENIYNNGMIRVLGGNGGAEGGQILLASSNSLEKGNLSVGTGQIIEIRPPQFSQQETQYLKFGKPKEMIKQISVLTRPDNLQIHWPMDETDGFILYDTVGENHANLSGNALRVVGKIGQAIEFDGTTAFAWSAPNFDQIGITGKKPRTITFWFLTSPIQSKSNPGLYGYGELSNYDGFDRYWGIDSISKNDFSSLTSEHYGSSLPFTHDIKIKGEWTHLAHLYDGNSISVFLNGLFIGSENNSNINTGNEEPLLFGRSDSSNNKYFKGLLDDFRIYNDTLLPIEIDQISRAQDIIEENIPNQFSFEIDGSVDELSIAGLPAGLTFDPQRLQVNGLPTESGIFDLNITAQNRAGKSLQGMQIVISKSLPVLSSINPRNISSQGGLASAMIHSDGGEAVEMTLFWGSTNGEDNVDEWENSYVLEDQNFTVGRVSKFIDGFD